MRPYIGIGLPALVRHIDVPGWLYCLLWKERSRQYLALDRVCLYCLRCAGCELVMLVVDAVVASVSVRGQDVAAGGVLVLRVRTYMCMICDGLLGCCVA